jgi:hypothetical protein
MTLSELQYIFIVFFELFFNGECDMGWGDFLESSELFFNGEMWCGMLLEFSRLFLIDKGDVTWGDFLEFFDVACYLNF